MEWLDESEKSLDSDVEIANEPDKIKIQLLQHKVNKHPLTSLNAWNQRAAIKLATISCA